MRQWPRARGIITWDPYLFTIPPYRPGPKTTHPEAAWRALATVAERCTE